MRYLLTLGLLLWAVSASAFTINGKIYSTWNGKTLASWNGVTLGAPYVPLDVTDNFNRANGGLGASWATVTGLAAPLISANAVVRNGGESGAVWTANTFGANQYSEASVSGLDSMGDGDGVAVFVQGRSDLRQYYNMYINCYTVGYDDSENPILGLFIGADGFAAVGTPGTASAVGYFGIYETSCPDGVTAIRLELVSGNLILKYKTTGAWITLATVPPVSSTEPGSVVVNLSGGAPGVHINGVAPSLDNWAGGNL